MFAPIFQVCAANAAVIAVLGSSPVRFYPFGEAPQDGAKPYAVWQSIGGSPENYLGDVPDVDTFGLQIDCYAESAQQCRDIAQALRDAIEPHAHIVAWRGDSRDVATKLYRYSFDVDWIVTR